MTYTDQANPRIATHSPQKPSLHLHLPPCLSLRPFAVCLPLTLYPDRSSIPRAFQSCRPRCQGTYYSLSPELLPDIVIPGTTHLHKTKVSGRGWTGCRCWETL